MIGIRIITVLNTVLTIPPLVPKSKRKKGTPRRPHSIEVMTGTMIGQLDKTWIIVLRNRKERQGQHRDRTIGALQIAPCAPTVPSHSCAS